MNVRVCPLASGSLGNALVVASPKARLLVDMGVPQRRLKADLRHVGVAPDDLAAVLLTHTHRDHFSTAAIGFCLGHGIRVLSSPENLKHLARTMPGFRRLVETGLAEPLDGEPLAIGDVTVEAFQVPHDAPGRCLGFRLTIGSGRSQRTVTVATDLGHVPQGCLDWFVDSDVVVLESNHDPEMLWESSRPADLIDRIAGPEGHLSNGDSAEAAEEIVGRSRPGRLKHMVLAHLSRDCNTPKLALEAHAYLASRASGTVHLAAASQFEPGPMIAL
jgi:phosphoribosyl 1,2-cyclic phosphodiesterase